MTGTVRGAAVGVLGMMVLASGCATKGQLRRGLEEQSAALQAERNERMAADQALGQDVSGLRTELAALQTEYGTRITQLEEGMQFAVPVHFAFDRADVTTEAQPVLNRFSEVVKRHYPGAKITVEGFADPAGSAAYNRQLSQRRADAVREYLVQSGIPSGQMASVGYGEERPVVPGAYGERLGADLNRRVVFVVETGPNSGFVPTTEVSSR